MTQTVNSSSDQDQNIKLVIDQSERLIDIHIKAIQQLDWKMSSSIGFAGILLKFNFDIAEDNLIHISCKIMSILCILTCFTFCLNGLFPLETGSGFLSPRTVFSEWLQWKNERVLVFAAKAAMNVEEELREKSAKKRNTLKWALLSLFISVISMSAGQLASMYSALNLTSLLK